MAPAGSLRVWICEGSSKGFEIPGFDGLGPLDLGIFTELGYPQVVALAHPIMTGSERASEVVKTAADTPT